MNKAATGVQIRFNVKRTRSLSYQTKQQMLRLAGRKITTEGVMIIKADRFRSQEKNRKDARGRLAAMVLKAARKPRNRKKTQPSFQAKQRRLDSKKRRAKIKLFRKRVSPGRDY